ncbi:hypothetical protein CI109_102099 [Kwoniella shandongensis]|uniref:Uncharacterized protein n=1 Tax=Kwoniella shandongensis TaxID=1734106 RepID=A0A5M6BSM0_9TREE|nr:uncharacterized protein CI109_005870 [Kwoniella shandongensis]KAA5525846.1 hypothetical protein CI109_005870 [Kwoniella shandongensis]
MDLGAPIGGAPTGEHGRGTGLSGGHGIATSANTQAGQFASEERSGFNGGVGGEHASAGIPKGTPIADKFTSSSSSGAGGVASGNIPEPYGNTSSTTGHHGHGLGQHGKLDNSLDRYEGEQNAATGAGIGSGRGNLSSGITGALDGASGHQHHSHGSTGETVSGAYAGSGTRDALTGESNAHTTGAGVGHLAENLHGSSHPHGPRDAALAGTAAGAGALAGGAAYESQSHSHHHHSTTGDGVTSGAGAAAPLTRGEGVAGYGQGQVPGIGGESGSGVGPSSGSGLTGQHQAGYGGNTGTGLAGAGAAGVAGVGAGAAGLAGSGHHHGNKTGTTGTTGTSGTQSGSHSTAEAQHSHKELDTGGPHSLVFQESTGQYVHRRDL